MAACQSFVSTSTHANLIAYVDDDQESMYRALTLPERCHLFVGRRVGPVEATNLLVHHHREPARIYGRISDDCLFLTPGWDDYVLRTIDGFPGRLGVLSIAWSNAEFVNFPWVSREWVETVGWYFFPRAFHHCCDTVLELLGDATRIVYSDPKDFEMAHAAVDYMNQEHLDADAKEFLHWCVTARRETVKKIRAAMAT